MRRIMAFVLALALALGAGCSGTETAQVCRIIAPEEQSGGELIAYESVPVADSETALDAALRALQSAPADQGLVNPLSGIVIESCNVVNGMALLYLSEDYLELSGVDRSVADACCVLTLCASDGIDRVTIYSGGRAVAIGLTPDDILLDNADTDGYRREACLYYISDDGRLVPEERSLSIPGSEYAERYVFDELLRPPEGMSSALPAGTQLISVTRKGRLCTVDLSGEFIDNGADTAAGRFMAVEALVNSLTSLGGISEVNITVEGEPVGEYGPLDLSSPLTGCRFITTGLSGEDALSSRLYFEWGGSLFGAPCVLDGSGGAEQAVLDALMSSAGFGLCRGLFAPTDELTQAGTSAGICTITVSRGFFSQRSEDEVVLAVDALVQSLLELEEVSAVIIRFTDGETPEHGGIDMSGPITEITSQVIE